MSATVAGRLSEIAERGEQRRHRMSEIRQRSSVAIDVFHRLQWEHAQRAWDLIARELRSPAASVADTECNAVMGPIEQAPRADVLEQVQQLLVEVNVRERDMWNEDDALILIHLQEAWAAARRHGYALEELQSILKALVLPNTEGDRDA